VRGFVIAAPQTMIHNYSPSIDKRALLVSLAAAVFCALFAGLPPALRLARADVEPALRAGGRGLASGRSRLQAVLVISQVATALVLATGAGLLVRSFIRLLDVNPGFDSDHVLTISTQMPGSARTPPQRTAIYQEMRTQLMSVPGVAEVAAVSRLPMLGRNLGSWIFIEGKSRPGDPKIDVEYRVATAGYFSAMGIPLRAGRIFNATDDADPGSAIIVNETAARRFWPGESPVGKHVKLTATPEKEPWRTVIGVVGDLRHVGLDVDVLPEIYRPYSVNPLGAPILVVRTSTDPAALAQTLVSRVQSVNSEVPAYDIHVMRDLVSRSASQRRFVMSILAGFALAALLLAGVGVFGVMSRLVTSRTPELGVRMALGATPGTAAQLIATQGARLAGAGVVAGLVGAAITTRLISALLFEVRPFDPIAFGAAVAVLIACTALACGVPVWRATRVDPLVALRCDD
jgi:predicted permease